MLYEPLGRRKGTLRVPKETKSVLHEPQIGSGEFGSGEFGSGELESGEFGSGDFGSGDIESGEFDQFEISQELRLTSTKIPGGIWSIYWSKLLSHRC